MNAYEHIRIIKGLGKADDLNKYSYGVDVDEIAKLMESYHEAKVKNLGLFDVRQQNELLKAFLIWFDGDLKLIDHKELIKEYFESLK